MWQAFYLAWVRWDLARRIRKHGWTGTYIRPDEEIGGSPFSYSIGFWESADAPEVIMFGMDPETANGLLHEAHRQLKAGELKLYDQAPWELDWEGGPPLRWRKVHRSQIRREYFNAAIWYCERQGRQRSDLQAYQLFVTDSGRKFPWEEGYDLAYRPIQEKLYLPYEGPPDQD